MFKPHPNTASTYHKKNYVLIYTKVWTNLRKILLNDRHIPEKDKRQCMILLMETYRNSQTISQSIVEDTDEVVRDEGEAVVARREDTGLIKSCR